MRILVIDDDLVLARSLKRLLRDHDVSVEGDGLTGLARIACAEEERAPFELVLCDFTMKGLNGLDVLIALRDRPDRPRFILMSGYDDIVDAALLADAVLLKPFGSDDVSAAIAQIKEVRSRASTQRVPRIRRTTVEDHV